MHAALSKEAHRIFYLENTRQHLGLGGRIILNFLYVNYDMIRLVQITYVPRLCEYGSEVSSPTMATNVLTG